MVHIVMLRPRYAARYVREIPRPAFERVGDKRVTVQLYSAADDRSRSSA